MDRVLTLELPATPEEVMRGVEQLQAFGCAQQVDEKALLGLALAFEECSANIVNHACGDQAHETFRVTIRATRRPSSSNCATDGPAFDPTSCGRPESNRGR